MNLYIIDHVRTWSKCVCIVKLVVMDVGSSLLAMRCKRRIVRAHYCSKHNSSDPMAT